MFPLRFGVVCFWSFFGPFVLLLGLFSLQETSRALDPSIASAYGGGYYHYQNASPAYRHGVKTPLNSYPHLPQIPTPPQAPSAPVVPLPTPSDWEPNPSQADHPYLGANGIGWYSDQVMEEYNPDNYRNPNPNHRNLHHHATDNPQEIPYAYQDRGNGGEGIDPMAGLTAPQTSSTDKPTHQKSSSRSKKSKKSKSSTKSVPLSN